MASDLRITNGKAAHLIFKRAWKTAGAVILAYLGIWIVISLTLARILFTTSLGTVLSLTPQLEGGAVPIGTQVYADIRADNTFDLLDNLLLSTTVHRNTIQAEVVEGPYGEFDHKKYNLPDAGLLSSEYVVKCLAGSCEPGTHYLIKKEHIIGTPVAADKIADVATLENNDETASPTPSEEG